VKSLSGSQHADDVANRIDDADAPVKSSDAVNGVRITMLRSLAARAERSPRTESSSARA